MTGWAVRCDGWAWELERRGMASTGSLSEEGARDGGTAEELESWIFLQGRCWKPARE